MMLVIGMHCRVQKLFTYNAKVLAFNKILTFKFYSLMLHKALESISLELQQYLEAIFPGEDTVDVLIDSMTQPDGSLRTFNKNTILITMINLEEEKTLRNSRISSTIRGPIQLNMFLLFSSFHGEDSEYMQSLEMLSEVISFFQDSQTFTHQNTPHLDPNLDKLVFEIMNFDMQALNYIWSVQGNRYLPSIIFKVRMIPISREQQFSPIIGRKMSLGG